MKLAGINLTKFKLKTAVEISYSKSHVVSFYWAYCHHLA